MDKFWILLLVTFFPFCGHSYAQLNRKLPVVQTLNGKLQGTNESGVKVFKGVPFAAPPVGDLRWKEPRPVKDWTGIRKADKFGSRPVQANVFGDMNFRSDSMSEDCLYLNVWTPAKTGNEKLPVLVYFYGGGLIAGSGDEPRYAGKSMARKGIVAITVNYRLGIFGFLAYPGLTKESPNHSSGNYGYLDQNAALKWIKKNVRAFGGDPDRITVAGESAGSISVSAQMASPLSKGLFEQAIASSGSVMGALPSIPLKEAEEQGVKMAGQLGAKNLKQLRAMSATELLRAKGRFAGNIDGYFMPKAPEKIYSEGQQLKVPMLIGWNSQEMTYPYLIGSQKPTLSNIHVYLEKRFGKQADRIMKIYGFTSEGSVIPASTQLASDLFIAFSTWKWSDMEAESSSLPVYRYHYCHPRPAMVLKGKESGLAGGVKDIKKDKNAGVHRDKGAVHSSDIEYAMGNLPTNRIYDWQPEDYEVAAVFQSYYANFIKTGNPNGLGLIDWPAVNGKAVPPVLQLDVNCVVTRDSQLQQRYEVMNSILYSSQTR